MEAADSSQVEGADPREGQQSHLQENGQRAERGRTEGRRGRPAWKEAAGCILGLWSGTVPPGCDPGSLATRSRAFRPRRTLWALFYASRFSRCCENCSRQVSIQSWIFQGCRILSLTQRQSLLANPVAILRCTPFAMCFLYLMN